MGTSIVFMLAISCGGGFAPKSLRVPRVDVSDWTPTKELILKEDRDDPLEVELERL